MPRRSYNAVAMEYEMKMPDLSTAEAEVSISEWYIEVGETVTRGQAIVSVETDKAQMDVESVINGQLKRIVADDGAKVEEGTVIAVFEVEGAPVRPASTPAAETEDPAPDSKAAATPRSTKSGGMFARNRSRRDET
ncbi:MAG: hypothetical protein CMJ18_24140 [Phycisphaeraceae bacterium]|nr:hypothetical protein [Phycisphaeraceae bacterium]